MEDDIAMFFKKKASKSVSVTHQSQKTFISVNGQEIDVGDGNVDVDIISLLKSQGIDTDMIPEDMLSEIAASLRVADKTSSTAVAGNANVKTECGSCSRSVPFGKGSCFYCGNPLTLPQAADSVQASNEVDAEFLNTDKIETRDGISQSDENFVDRLGDI